MSTPATFTAVCKIEYQPVVDDNSEVIPSNLGALRMGLEALQKEDAADFLRADQLWAKGRALLIEESEDDQGSAANQKLQIDDDFGLALLGDDYDWGHGGLW